MGESLQARRGQSERLRDYFEIQLLFAARLAERTPLPLSEACLRFTNLHRRFGFGRVTEAGPAAEWLAYADGLDRCGSAAERLDWTVDVFNGSRQEAHSAPRFGCFSFEPPNAEGAVRIHFSNRDSDDGVGPLDRRKMGRRKGDLAQMFGHVRAQHPEARSVLGGSWLYNLEAYCRLFPPQYVASRSEPRFVRLDGGSSWGQLLDFRGWVKPAVRDAFLANLTRLDVTAPWRAFPLRALRAQCGIEHFHRFYGP
jgi:hypothetical protein